MNKIAFISILTLVGILSIFFLKDIATYTLTLVGVLFIDLLVLAWDIRSEIKHKKQQLSYQHNNA